MKISIIHNRERGTARAPFCKVAVFENVHAAEARRRFLNNCVPCSVGEHILKMCFPPKRGARVFTTVCSRRSAVHIFKH